MTAIKAKFDGEKIELPAELHGAAPAEVLVIYPSDKHDVSTPVDSKRPSIWDAIGKARVKRTAEDIDAQIRELRDEWGD